MPKFRNAILFEVSWEVCNKVGGIHTVLRSKIAQAVAEFGDNYYLLGPLLPRNIEFEETDEACWRAIREPLAVKGLNVRLGRWAVPGRPKVILVDPGTRLNVEQLLFHLWERFGVDSIAGGWDYVEPVVFSTTCGEVIASLANQAATSASGQQVVAHFHEWMTGAGLLYVKEKAPSVATVFTTHATVLGRSMMGAGRDIYAQMEEINPLQEAKNHSVTAKHSLESVTARQADCFTTVSEITGREARRFLGREPSLITPNGINIGAITNLAVDRTQAIASRQAVLEYGRRFFGTELPANTRLVMISGRYEFVNKGIDVFIEALGEVRGKLREDQYLLACLFVLGGHMEHRPERSAGGNPPSAPGVCSHRLPDENNDAIVNACLRVGLTNQPADRVKVIFIPVYLSEGDGVLNRSYYDVMQGFDLGVFPSKYEPWGYTPMESVAYAVPTVTTDQAGFGLWVRHYIPDDEHRGARVIDRQGRETKEIAAEVAASLLRFMGWDEAEMAVRRRAARAIGEKCDWADFYRHYLESYELGLRASEKRAFREEAIRTGLVGRVLKATESARPHFRTLVVETEVPKELARLRELANNLWWSWHPAARALFKRIDPHVWEAVRHNPVRLLDEVVPERLVELARNKAYVQSYRDVVAAFEAYKSDERLCPLMEADDAIGWNHPVAYFSTEFGLHESLPIYSGGLGVLSGDHLKSASDMNLPLIGVGLFYKHGYFRQRIDAEGRQVAEYPENDPSLLPMKQVQDDNGTPTTIAVGLPGRTLYAGIWRVQVGRITLYLLDTDLPANTTQDRAITGQLYVGDERIRIEQEILLGIGGARLLRRLGITPSCYHLNEGHSAFLILELIRTVMQEQQMASDEALELIRSRIVFTTHTPVEAGNERFPRDLMQHYFAHYLKEVGVPPERFFELGRMAPGEAQPFIMTILALKGSFLANGVSELHGRVARKMWEGVWNGVHRSMVPILSVTNGIHASSVVSHEMHALLDTYVGMNWDDADMVDTAKWSRVHTIPDDLLWDARIEMKQRLISYVKEQLATKWTPGEEDENVSVEEVVSRVRSSALTIGFARRFAPYKRAHLLFHDIDRLVSLVNNPRRPVQFIFAGKAHPKDTAGCDLVAEVVKQTRDPRLAGRVIFLEDYDLGTAKLLVRGVDVWLNTPCRPFEASGTSGQKAAVNGGINLSVADGWWCEGAADGNGWTIGLPSREVDEDSTSVDLQDASHLYSLLEDVVVPLYYQRNKKGIPEGWLAVMRRSLETIGPRFNTHRMLIDYHNRMYRPCARRARAMAADSGRMARELAAWKRRAPSRFSSVQILDITTTGLAANAIQVGTAFGVSVRVDLGEMKPDELCLELIVGRSDPKQRVRNPEQVPLAPAEPSKDRVTTFKGEFRATGKGSYAYGIRIMPYHPDLGHKEEMGLVVWA